MTGAICQITIDSCKQALREHDARMDELEAQNAELLEDRKRLEWLIDQMQFTDMDVAMMPSGGWDVIGEGGIVATGHDNWREAIDKAKGE